MNRDGGNVICSEKGLEKWQKLFCLCVFISTGHC